MQKLRKDRDRDATPPGERCVYDWQEHLRGLQAATAGNDVIRVSHTVNNWQARLDSDIEWLPSLLNTTRTAPLRLLRYATSRIRIRQPPRLASTTVQLNKHTKQSSHGSFLGKSTHKSSLPGARALSSENLAGPHASRNGDGNKLKSIIGLTRFYCESL